MDNTEIHYLTYDPEEIFQEMNLAYIQAGGDILYPGDEKEMLLRGVQQDRRQLPCGQDTQHGAVSPRLSRLLRRPA